MGIHQRQTGQIASSSLERGLAPARWLEELDPRAKLLVALGYAIVVALTRSKLVATAALGPGVVLLAASGVSPRALIKRLLAVNAFIALVWVMLPWRVVGGVGIDPQGLDMATTITLKANAVYMVLLGLLGTSRAQELFHAMAHLHLPGKLIALLMFFYRYIHLIHREYFRLKQAMSARGFTPRSDLHTYRSYAAVIGALLLRSYDRAERVYQAMICRGFSGTLWLIDHFHWKRADTAFCVLGACVVGALVWLQWVS